MRDKSMSNLVNFAPHRREKKTGKDKQGDAPAASSVPALNSTGGQPNPGNDDGTLDRLASALLESTIHNHPNGLASHPSVLLCGPEPFTLPTDSSPAQVDINTNVAMHGAGAPSGDGPVFAQCGGLSSGADQLVPAIPHAEAAVVKRLFPQSRTTMLDPVKRRGVVLPASTTAPLGGLAKRSDVALVGSDSFATNKTVAMLAAHDALKPPGSQNSTHITSKPSSSRRKNVLSKVRQAFDIFQPKSAIPESKIRGKISAPLAMATCNLPNPAAHFHLEEVDEASSDSDGDFSRDGVANLNSRKIQSIVGGCIIRKAAPVDGTSIRSTCSGEDPFSEAYEIVRTPTPFEHRLKISLDSDIPPVPTVNPFHRDDFDADLEGILPENPLGASTPRKRVDRKAGCMESPSQRYMKPSNRFPESVGEAEGSRDTQRKLKLDMDSVRLFHDQQDLSTKKHPSPSKEELDSLESQFRAYAILQIENAPTEDRDALTAKFAGLIVPHALTQCDKNIPIKSSADKKDLVRDCGANSERKHSRDSSVMSTGHSRIPRPVEPGHKIRSAPRLALQRQPANADAMELDELQ
ncbi:hypothetical protein CCHL11_08438 [Colletotrichum chlorophyti]|uniref:Uncharacterized protein n=1 Tax=Colletotrichum chlorophyti TaxID=708187 RepID=A0A1Q8RQ91_9PEZI|nr:hypothetical protein CCHL11_08438 [Colletotrichum chlorophyti]